MNTEQKFAAAFLLFFAWGALVFSGLAPVADFVTALKEGLIALGVFHTALTRPDK